MHNNSIVQPNVVQTIKKCANYDHTIVVYYSLLAKSTYVYYIALFALQLHYGRAWVTGTIAIRVDVDGRAGNGGNTG